MNRSTKIMIIVLVAALGVAAAVLVAVYLLVITRPPAPALPISRTMKLESPAFGQNDLIPERYTCDGPNLLPPLRVSGTPPEAQALAFIVDDPDAPLGTFTHWLIWNVDPAVTEIKEGQALAGVEGTTGFGRAGWSGPCPPSGEHHYFFKVYALDAPLDLPPGSDTAAFEQAIHDHVLDKAGLVGLYRRTP